MQYALANIKENGVPEYLINLVRGENSKEKVSMNNNILNKFDLEAEVRQSLI